MNMYILKSPSEMNGGSNGTVLTSCVLHDNPNTGFEIVQSPMSQLRVRARYSSCGPIKRGQK